MESSTTSSSVPTTSTCHTERCACGGLMLAIDACQTYKCKECGIVEKIEEIEEREEGQQPLNRRT